MPYGEEEEARGHFLWPTMPPFFTTYLVTKVRVALCLCVDATTTNNIAAMDVLSVSPFKSLFHLWHMVGSLSCQLVQLHINFAF